MSIKYKKQNQHQTIPSDVAEALRSITDKDTRSSYIKALRIKDWTLSSIASAIGVTRERVRQLEKEASPSVMLEIMHSGEFPLPDPPQIAYEVKDPPVYIEPSAETLSRLLELQPVAQSVRYNHSAGRDEAEEYTALLHFAHTVEGVTLYRLAKRLGITHGAIRFRLARYGYITPKTGKSKVYTQVKNENRSVRSIL